MSTSSDRAAAPVDSAVSTRPVLALATVLVAAVLVLADASIVNVAIPVLREDLGASFGQSQLIIAVYQICYAALLITGGRLGDLFGRRRLFVLGLTGFVLTSVACGLAPTPVFLIVARALQGATAALMFPQTLSVIQVAVPRERRPAAIAAFGITSAAATILGPLLSGAIIQLDLLGSSWRPSFLINLPIGAIGLLMAARYLPESRSEQAKKLDFGGVVLITAALAAAIVGLIEGKDQQWPAWAIGLIVASVPLFALFHWRCRAVQARTQSALVPPALWKDRGFVTGLIVYVLAYSCVLSFFLYQSITLQYGVGYTALQTGLTSTAYAVGTIAGYQIAVRVQKKVAGRTICFAGSALWTVGTAGILATVALTGDRLSGWYLLPALVVAGFGAGFMIGPLLGTILSGVHSSDAGAASGLLTTGQQVGGAVGIAVAGAVFLGALGTPGEDGALHHYSGAFTAALILMTAVLAVNTVLVRLLPSAKKP
ncbi:MFS transporter [Amycolatopsis silviterrae]|uniref:MFS transporter n=1 Tax=Amycolatopsis silviterrae TaxID=1656914 RepID=A0ABW5H3Q7_9PSEU